MISPVAPVERNRRATFDDKEPMTHMITAYSNVYGTHPSTCTFDKDESVIRIARNDDSFTSGGMEELTRRKKELLYDIVKRSQALRKALLDGGAWD